MVSFQKPSSQKPKGKEVEKTMKNAMILIILILWCVRPVLADSDITLPDVQGSNLDTIQGLEKRIASRRYSTREVSLGAIGTILWAGNGIIKRSGEDQTVHGYDTLSGATPNVRYSVPWGWGRPYIKLYVLLKEGAYLYVPEDHKLEFASQENLIQKSGSSASNPYGVIVIAADFSQMPGGENEMTKNVAHLPAGSSAQNMYTAGILHDVQMLTQITINHAVLKEGLDLPEDVVPLALLSFGHSD